jgi:flagellar biosynthetic protein FliR
MGLQLSAPFIVFGFVVTASIGLLARLMPQLQVFFVAMPASIWVGLILVAFLLAMMMGWYLTHFQNELELFRGR